MRRISNTTQCESANGVCSIETDCDLAGNLFLGSCDSDDHGCCASKLHVCAAKNGTCMTADECEGNEGHHASRMACSEDSVCCVPDRPFSRYGPMHRRGPRKLNVIFCSIFTMQFSTMAHQFIDCELVWRWLCIDPIVSLAYSIVYKSSAFIASLSDAALLSKRDNLTG